MPAPSRSQCHRAIPGALTVALLASLLLPATAFAADPQRGDPGASATVRQPASEPSATVEPSPDQSPPATPEPTADSTAPATPEPTADSTPPATPEPTADSTPSATSTPGADPTASASPDGGPSTVPSPSDAAASPDVSADPSYDSAPTQTPPDDRSASSPPASDAPSSMPAAPSSGVRVLSTSSETSTSLTGYRYTIRGAALHAERDTTSAQLLWLEADAQLSVSESVMHAGREWITGSFNGTTGYIPASELSMTSAPQPFSVTRYTRQWSHLYSSILGSATATVPAYTTVATHSAALDYLGRRWVYVSFSDRGGTHRGYQPWWHTTTLPVSATGIWTAVRATSLLLYPYPESPVVRSVAEGSLVSRRAAVTDTLQTRWIRGVMGSTWGWIRSADLTPPFKQYVWNRKSPVTQQYTNYYCVPASVQTELNIGLLRNNTSNSYQRTIYYYGRKNLGYWTGGVGLDPQAWERALSYFSGSAVDYVDATFDSYYAAIKAGALQMRRTGLPVGLLVYYGNHAWTMVGYTATADPLRTNAFRVTGVYVAAPFVRWTDPPAGTYLSYSQFARKMTPYIEDVRWTRWNGRYTIVLPQG